MTINIYIADLNAYNNGELKGEWVNLPVTKEELNEIIATHSNNGQFDYAIHDYEAPFQITETSNPYKLNNIAQWLEEKNVDLSEITEQLRNYDLENALSSIQSLASDIDSDFNTETYDFVSDFVTIEEAEEMAKEQLESGGLARLYFFMGNCNFVNDNVFRLNGYANLETLTKDMLESALSDVLNILLENIK